MGFVYAFLFLLSEVLDLFKEVGLVKLLVPILSFPCMTVSPFYLLSCCVGGSVFFIFMALVASLFSGT